MLPNRFPDEGESPNTIPSTRHFGIFEAIRAYADATGDFDVCSRTSLRKACDIIAWHFRGTRYDIQVDTDGLLYAGGPGEQLTWMDAKIGDLVITPRTGKPVEIQALWYSALCDQCRASRTVRARTTDADRFHSMPGIGPIQL